jgi:muconolactone delta-isomerase
MSYYTPDNPPPVGEFKKLDEIAVPTTKMLAIGTVTDNGTVAQRDEVRPFEVRETVRLHLEGKIEQWFYRTEGPRGVVFILNVADKQEAHELLEKLPLGVAGFMTFELIPLGPLRPLGLLL